MEFVMRLGMRLVFGILLAAACSGPLLAQESGPAGNGNAPYFRGKQIRILLSAGVAGGYAEYGRLLTQHLGNHIAGKPDFIVQSMPGAGGLLATNYLYSQAPADGTTIGLIHASVPLMPLLGSRGARFDPLKFNWLGSLDRSDGPCTAWHTSPVKTWANMLERQFIVGSSGVGSQMDVYPAMLNKLFGTKIKVVGGYRDGASIFLAMERGEIEGRCGPQITAIWSLRPQWFTERKVALPIMISERRSEEFPATPSIMEFAKDERTRQLLRLLIVTQDLDRPLLLPPGVPAERVRELRDAFNATVKDPAFLADAQKMRLHLDPVSGEDVLKALTAAYAVPAEIVEIARETMGEK
jgi:tripartite-type tricarboxylate transporter receptor subunit TctC